MERKHKGKQTEESYPWNRFYQREVTNSALNQSEFRRIQVHTRYLKRILANDIGNPDAIKEVYEMRIRLAKLTVSELDRENLNFHEVSVVIYALDELLDGDDAN